MCCCESYVIQQQKGQLRCITEVPLFQHVVLSKEGLQYSRYLFSMNIVDEQRRTNYLGVELTPSKLRFLAYKCFINLLNSADFNRRARYIIPSCVVSAIREQFPNTNGEPYTGFISISSSDGHILP